jgi:hypothetical protein
MPIDMTDYTRRRRQHLRDVGAYCIFVVGPTTTGPLKIGYAADVVQRFGSMCADNWLPISVHHLMWCPGRPIAVRVESEVHSILDRANKRIRGEWFDVDIEWATRTVHFAAIKLYPTAVFLTHERMIAFLRERETKRREG